MESSSGNKQCPSESRKLGGREGEASGRAARDIAWGAKRLI